MILLFLFIALNKVTANTIVPWITASILNHPYSSWGCYANSSVLTSVADFKHFNGKNKFQNITQLDNDS
ncbi:hypothetical protein HMI54_009370 [Coelomomyces lativittatus]|nr:hypothetical protein HMI54_009370 [Coelomomyces lativittatus]